MIVLEILAMASLVGVVVVLCVGMYGAVGGFDEPYEPMTEEEERLYLADQGLSEEEIEEIVNIPWRGR